ncbi:hypothetical protein IW262DRAFT_345772 [Armillaria fumosa]|nr:hypothetical protein IW262DRAFT_345772 [Armillaria fumosa]
MHRTSSPQNPLNTVHFPRDPLSPLCRNQCVRRRPRPSSSPRRCPRRHPWSTTARLVNKFYSQLCPRLPFTMVSLSVIVTGRPQLRHYKWSDGYPPSLLYTRMILTATPLVPRTSSVTVRINSRDSGRTQLAAGPELMARLISSNMLSTTHPERMGTSMIVSCTRPGRSARTSLCAVCFILGVI